jgi:hypothetical protein
MAYKRENARERGVMLATEVTEEVREAIESIAAEEERSLSYVTWKLLLESPRVRERLEQIQQVAA